MTALFSGVAVGIVRLARSLFRLIVQQTNQFTTTIP